MATTKKPAAKKTAVIKAHRGMAHVPKNPRRRPPNLQVEPRRLGIDRPQMPRGRNTQIMTPAQRDAMRRQRQLALARRRFNQRRGQPQPFTPAMRDLARRQSAEARKRMQQMTPAQRDAAMKRIEAARKRQLEALNNPKARPRLPIRRRPTVEQLSDARRRQLEGTFTTTRPKRRRPVGDPKPRKRPTTPKQKQRVVQATQAPRTRPKSRRVI